MVTIAKTVAEQLEMIKNVYTTDPEAVAYLEEWGEKFIKPAINLIIEGKMDEADKYLGDAFNQVQKDHFKK